jgi:hypothetical protein
MKNPKKHDIALIIGLCIPVLMIVLMAGAIYLPRLFVDVDPPRFDFLYTVGYPRDVCYVVEDGRLLRNEGTTDCRWTSYPGHPPLQLFVHHVADNVSEQLSFEEASALKLDTSALSPDGFELTYGRKSELFFPMFSSRDSSKRYLQKDGLTVKLDLEMSAGLGNLHTLRFLGWIEEE